MTCDLLCNRCKEYAHNHVAYEHQNDPVDFEALNKISNEHSHDIYKPKHSDREIIKDKKKDIVGASGKVGFV